MLLKGIPAFLAVAVLDYSHQPQNLIAALTVILGAKCGFRNIN